MKPTRKFLSFLLVMLFLLLACQVSGTATPAALNGSARHAGDATVHLRQPGKRSHRPLSQRLDHPGPRAG